MQMMKCVEPVWFGDQFIAKDTLLPVGHPNAVEPFFVAIAFEDAPSKKSTK
jgi:hypothetical protein